MYNTEILTQAVKQKIGFMEEPDIALDSTKVKIVSQVAKAINKRHPLVKLKIIDRIKPINEDLSTFLSEILDRAVHNVLSKTYTQKRISETLKGVLGTVKGLYHMTDIQGSPEQFTDKFVGYRVAPITSDYVTLDIHRMSLALMSPQSINLYVYHSSDLSTPYKTVPLNITKAGRPTWIDFEEPIKLDFFDKNLDRGGYYYIGIKTEDLSPMNMLITRKYDWDRDKICGSCQPIDKAYWDTWRQFSRFNPISADLNSEDGISEVKRLNNTTVGINLSYTVSCDVTQFLVDNLHLLEETVIIETVAVLLEEIINSTEVNRIAGVTKRDAELALYGEFSSNGNERIRDGFEAMREKQIEAFNLDISGYPDYCLKCNKKRNSIQWR